MPVSVLKNLDQRKILKFHLKQQINFLGLPSIFEAKLLKTIECCFSGGWAQEISTIFQNYYNFVSYLAVLS